MSRDIRHFFVCGKLESADMVFIDLRIAQGIILVTIFQRRASQIGPFGEP